VSLSDDRGEVVEPMFEYQVEAVLEAPWLVRRASAGGDAREWGVAAALDQARRSSSRVSRVAEARIVSEVEVNVAAQRSVVLQHGPATTGNGIGLVETIPREFETGPSVARSLSPVDPALDCDEREAACVIRVELDEPGSNQVHILLVPKIHLHDPPPANGDGHLAPRFVRHRCRPLRRAVAAEQITEGDVTR
jgi:hypothetical protein